jgi:3-oxoacyl-[acyl-carrier-protein] synthase II
MRRVVITGMGGMSPIGHSWPEIEQALHSYRNNVRYIPEWEIFSGLNSRLASPLPPFELPVHYTRKRTRGMGRVARLATRSSEMALEAAGLLDDPIISSGRTGVAYGSSSGSTPALSDMARLLITESTDSVKANTYIQMMPHTTAVNVSVFFGTRGRLIPTSSACTSGSMAIGMAYEAICRGQQTVMIAGGAEELCPSQTAVFDTLFATSTRNDEPEKTPRPFDAARDGMTVGEGAATLILEDLDHARARGAKIHAEIVGFATTTDGKHLTQPAAESMAMAMRLALEDAGLPAQEVGYVNAHGTATELGDIAESQATLSIYARPVPISSLKSYIGHTLGACGSIEAWVTVEMLNSDWYAPTINLEHIDPRCAELDYITERGRSMQNEYVMTNKFAFGGVNTSLIFRRWQ